MIKKVLALVLLLGVGACNSPQTVLTYVWNEPTENPELVKSYIVEKSIEGGDWEQHKTTPITRVTVLAKYDESIQIRVKAVGEDGLFSQYSIPSKKYTPIKK